MIASRFAFAGRVFLEIDTRQLITALNELAPADSELLAMDRALQESGQELEKEYVRLFLNPAGAPCSPWQSAHDEDGRLMGSAHQSALSWYGRYGAVPKNTNEPADHVGLLLMFYAQLVAAGVPETERRMFADQHLLWIVEFAEKVRAESRSKFYSAFSEWLAGLLRHEFVQRAQASG